MVLTRPGEGNPIGTMHGDADENDGIEFANQRAMCDYLAETSASPMSLSTNNRSQGFPLCNTRNQLHKLDALYDDDEEQSLCLNHSSMDHSRDYSLDNGGDETEFCLKPCVSRKDRNSLSPMYALSSASSTASSSESDGENDESEFLIEARASLMALQEWEHFDTIPSYDDEKHGIGNCDASCNSSYDGNLEVDTQSACDCDFDKFRGNRAIDLDIGHSCPDIFPRKRTVQLRHPVSTKTWLQEIKNEELLQRKRIADAIAAANTPASHKRRGSKSVLFNNPAKLFRNKENVGNDLKHDVSKDRKGGRHKLMRSMASFGRRQRRNGRIEGGDEERDGRKASTPNSVSAVAQIVSPNGNQQPSSTGLTKNSSNKELELKRAFLGSARVVTMDGVVESFADGSAAAIAAAQSGRNALEQIPVGKRLSFAPTSDAPLTWV